MKGMVNKAGGVREFARCHKISAANVSDAVRGKRPLGPSLLKLMRMEKWVNVSYYRVHT